MTKIVAIGGWGGAPENIKEVNEKIFSICKKNNPKILFIPTAKSDDEEYCNIFKNHYESLGGKVDFLFLIKEKTSFKEIEEKILNSDIVYVGGGNTLKMMTLWRKLGVDKVLKKALEKDIVLAGTSAGAICWFKYGNSDSRKFTSNSDKLIKVTGLNFVNAFICPHYSGEINRQSSLKDMLKKNNMVGIALDDLSAISIENDNFEIITSSQNAKGYKFYWKKGEYIKEEIVKGKLKDLVKK